MALAPDAVVMEMEKGSVSTGGTVTMETPIAVAATVKQAEPQESVQHHGQHQQHNRHRMLIVVGEISSSYHLSTVRTQITQGG